MLDVVKNIERWVTLVLVGMLVVVVVLATVELGHTLLVDIMTPPVLFPGIDKLLAIFGKTLLVVIGLELIETLRAFAADRTVRVEVVLTVAVIALTRKIIVLEVGHVSSLDMLGLAALLASLALAYRVYIRK
jgi:uncharacterized membrane protein (DUF373 family)